MILRQILIHIYIYHDMFTRVVICSKSVKYQSEYCNQCIHWWTMQPADVRPWIRLQDLLTCISLWRGYRLQHWLSCVEMWISVLKEYYINLEQIKHQVENILFYLINVGLHSFSPNTHYIICILPSAWVGKLLLTATLFTLWAELIVSLGRK